MLWVHSTLQTGRTCPFRRLAGCSQAAKSRKQEPISPVSSAHEGDVTFPSNGRPTRGIANTTNAKLPARQVSPGPSKLSANGSGKAVESVPKPKPRVIRLSRPDSADPVVANTEPKAAPTIENRSAQNDDGSTTWAPSPPPCDAVCSALEATSTPHSSAVPKHATNEATSVGDERPARVNLATSRELAEANGGMGIVYRRGNEGGGIGGASEYLAQQRRCAVREREVTRTLPPLPPDAEVLEVSFGWFYDFRSLVRFPW